MGVELWNLEINQPEHILLLIKLQIFTLSQRLNNLFSLGDAQLLDLVALDEALELYVVLGVGGHFLVEELVVLEIVG